MTFTVDSYLEFFLTLLGWIINNGIFGLLVQTGLIILPLIIIMLKTFLEVKKQGEDEGNKGELLISWLGISFFPAMFMIVFALAPAIPISLNKIEMNVEQSKQCGYAVPKRPEQTSYGSLSTELSGQTAKVPLWWGLMHMINKGITHGAISVIPCQPDLRQIRFEVQHQKINNPALINEIKQFVSQCYVPARQRLFQAQPNMTPAQVRDTEWLGGRILVTNPELYPKYRAQQPNAYWRYDRRRDAGLANTGRGGYPRCDDWWANSDVGLKVRLLNDLRNNFSAKVTDMLNTKDNAEEAILRGALKPENVNVSGGKVYPGYGGNLDQTFMNTIGRTASAVGTGLGSLAAFPALDAMRQALPMVHSFGSMVLIILIPIVLVISGYNLKTLVTLSVVLFAFQFIIFWWELARWLDSWLLSVLYDSSAHNSWNMHFIENTENDVIVNMVMGSLFIVIPGIWLASMSWAGVRLGNLADQFRNGANEAQKSGGNWKKPI